MLSLTFDIPSPWISTSTFDSLVQPVQIRQAWDLAILGRQVLPWCLKVWQILSLNSDKKITWQIRMQKISSYFKIHYKQTMNWNVIFECWIIDCKIIFQNAWANLTLNCKLQNAFFNLHHRTKKNSLKCNWFCFYLKLYFYKTVKCNYNFSCWIINYIFKEQSHVKFQIELSIVNWKSLCIMGEKNIS